MKKINMELNNERKKQGFSMLANVNVDYIRLLKRCNKEDGKAITEAIKCGDAKKAVQHMSNAKNRNQAIRNISAHHDTIVYLNGEEWGIFKADTRKCYEWEK